MSHIKGEHFCKDATFVITINKDVLEFRVKVWYFQMLYSVMLWPLECMIKKAWF